VHEKRQSFVYWKNPRDLFWNTAPLIQCIPTNVPRTSISLFQDFSFISIKNLSDNHFSSNISIFKNYLLTISNNFSKYNKIQHVRLSRWEMLLGLHQSA
jgi:hypothetical protein